MRITYYALKNLQVGTDFREPGDLVPEANDWKFLSAYVNEGALAPVLVATLPEEQQVLLLEWEESQKPSATEAAPEPDSDPVPDEVPAPDEEVSAGTANTRKPRKPNKQTDTSEKVA